MNFIRITNTSEEIFHKAWELYEKSFPVYERRTLKTHIQALDNENFHCTYIKENNKFIGILFYWNLDKYTYIEHFAISEELRNLGYGSKVLKEFSLKNNSLILEIDPPVDEISIKRYEFYKKLGFKLYDFKHIQMPYRKNYEGYELKILYNGDTLNYRDYNDFYNSMLGNLLAYCEK